MPRFFKSKQSSNAPAPAPTPTSPIELVQNLASRRDSKALAATSSAIALSISSAFNDARGTSSDGATGQGGDTGWQTAYAAVRMAIEIAKESSDLCLPLKAVVGAMSALMKNYDVSVLFTNTFSSFDCFLLQQMSDNAENMKGIERRVHSLYGVLAAPVSEDDSAEKARRVELRRFVSMHIRSNLLIPLSGGLMELLRSWNHSLSSVCSSNSCGMWTMPRH